MPSNPNPTKAERREAAREQAKQLREAQARRDRRNRNILIGGVIALMVVVAIALYVIISQGSKTVAESVDTVPANVSVEDGGISLGSDLVAGTANEGAPVLDVYLDYTCSFCAMFEEINAGDVEEMVTAGDATVVFHPVAILDRTGEFSGYSGRSAQAAAVVADAAPEAFADFHAALFALWAEAVDAGASESGGDVEPTDDDIAAAAVESGVPQDVADSIAEGRFTEWVSATTEQFGRDGFTGTPTVLVDGEVFQEWNTPGALVEAVTGE